MRKLFSIFVAVIAIASISFWGCKKDAFLSETELAQNSSKNIEVSDVKDWYSVYQKTLDSKSANTRSEEKEIPFRVKPVLGLAYKTQWDNHDVVISPIEKSDLFVTNRTQTGMLVFTKKVDGEIHSTLLIITGDQDKYRNPWDLMKSNDFTGGIMSINEKHEFEQYRIIENGYETGYTDILSDVEGFESIAKGRDDEWPPSWWPWGNGCPNPNGSGKPLTPKVRPKKTKKNNSGDDSGSGGGFTFGYLGTPISWAQIPVGSGTEFPPEPQGVDPNKFCHDLAKEINADVLTQLLDGEGNANDVKKLIDEGKVSMALIDIGDNGEKTPNKQKIKELLDKYLKISKLLYTANFRCEDIELMWDNAELADVMSCYLDSNDYSSEAMEKARQTMFDLKVDIQTNPNLIQDLLDKGVPCSDIVPTCDALAGMRRVAPNDPIAFQDILNCLNPKKKDGHTYFASYGVDDPTNGGFSFLNGTNPGHAFVTLTEKDPSGNIVANYTFGFYPNCKPTTAGASQSCWGQLGNDQNHEVDVSWTFQLKDFDAYMSVINGIPNSSNTTWSFSYSCVTFAQQCMANGGVSMGTIDLYTPHGWAGYLKNWPCVNGKGGDKGVLGAQSKTPANKCNK